MSQTQYDSLMSSLLNEKHTLTKLRAELEERRGKLCRYCKEFGYLAQNCRKKKEGEKGTNVPQNKFKVLKSRVMQCRVREKTIKRIEAVEVECYKCREIGHKCKECLLWKKMKEEKRRVEERAMHVAMSQKTQ